MKQLTQKLKTGNMQVLEVPVLDLRPGMVLVQNHYSLISAGTEGSTVSTARKGYIGKIKDRPQQEPGLGSNLDGLLPKSKFDENQQSGQGPHLIKSKGIGGRP